MKRKLDKKERILTKKGIKRRKERLRDFKKELKYLNAFDTFNKEWKDYLDAKKLNEEKAKANYVEMARKKLKEDIRFDEGALKQEKLQLEEGVEVKTTEYVN